MAGLRFLPLIAIAACADLSGLNNLEVGDAQSDVVQQVDAGGDAAIAETSIDSPVVADGADAADAGTFCTTQAQPWLWCADFDESDYTQGFLNGVPASWTSISGGSSSKLFASPPSSVHFDGTTKEYLAFTHAPTGLTTLEATGQLQFVSTPIAGDSSVLVIALTPTYSLKLVSGNGQQGVTMSCNEVTTQSDGGLQTIGHPLGSLSTGTWLYVDVLVTATNVNVSVAGAKASFPHTVQATQSVSTVFGFDVGWTGNWDSIRVSF